MPQQTTYTAHPSADTVALVRPAVDSLAVCREPLPFHPLFPESPRVKHDLLSQIDTLVVLPTKIFGPQTKLSTAQLSSTTVQPSSNVSVTSDPYQWQPASATLALICMFCFALYRYHAPLRLAFKNMFTIEGTLDIFDNPSRDMSHFINFSRLMFALSVSIPLATMAIQFAPQIITPVFYYPALVGVALLLMLIVSISTLVSRAAGACSDSQALFAEARAISGFNSVVAAYILAPIITIATLANSITLWTLIPVIILALYHIARLFQYLYLQKFSFLQWFLYLCGVEITPLLLIPAIAVALTV